MKCLVVYADASAIGGCEDQEFAADSMALWQRFVDGRYRLLLSVHTLRELEGAPPAVRAHVARVPPGHHSVLEDSGESALLAEAYLARGIVGLGSRSDAIHVALATAARADVLVSWNFKHIVNLGKIRLFNAVNLERGYGLLEIRTPKEVLDYE
jgi:hypothetical protein